MKHRPLWLLAALLLGSSGDALAYEQVIPLESPAWFVQAFGGYDYLKRNEETDRDGSSVITVFEETRREWIAGGSATLPVFSRLGARLLLDGGALRVTRGGVVSEIGGLTAGGQLFVRDPTKGQFGAGYTYTWATPRMSPSILDSVREHSIPVVASLYTPDLGGGATDWTLRFAYDWREYRYVAPLGDDHEWAYSLGGESTWYVNRFVDFRGGVEYQRLIGPAPHNVIQGVFALEVLVPSGVRHYGTVTLDGSVGRIEDEDLPAPFYTVSRLTWGIGVTVSVHFPGVTSLVELNRAYR